MKYFSKKTGILSTYAMGFADCKSPRLPFSRNGIKKWRWVLIFIAVGFCMIAGCTTYPSFTEMIEAPQTIAPMDQAILYTKKPTFVWTRITHADQYMLYIDGDAYYQGSEAKFEWMETTQNEIQPPQLELPFREEPYTWIVRAENPYQYSLSDTYRFLLVDQSPPSISATAPLQDSLIHETIGMQGVLEDNGVLAGAQFQILDRQKNVIQTWTSLYVSYTEDKKQGTFELDYPTDGLEGGLYFLLFRGFDEGGNISELDEIVVYITDSTMIPTLDPTEEIICTPKPTLHWSYPIYAQSFHLQLSTQADFETILINQETTSPFQIEGWEQDFIERNNYSIPFPLKSGNTYYWRVRAEVEYNDETFYANWSTASEFTVLHHDAPTLLLPPSNATVDTAGPSFEWGSVLGAQGYRLRVGTDPNFDNAAVLDINLDSSQTLYKVDEPLSNGGYFWQVIADFPYCDSGLEQQSYFQLDALISAVIPAGKYGGLGETAPCGDLSCTSHMKFRWSRPSFATRFHYQVDDEPTFSEPWLVDTIISPAPASYTYDMYNDLGEVANGTYYFRVQASDYIGSEGIYTYCQYQKASINGIPILSEPEDGSVHCSLDFSWESVSGAVQYRLQLSTLSNFSSIAEEIVTTNLNYVPSPSIVPDLYYWRVRGEYPPTCNGGWSETREVLLPIPVGSVTSLIPSDCQQYDDPTPAFSWFPDSEADAYNFQIASCSANQKGVEGNYLNPVYETVLTDGMSSNLNLQATDALSNGCYYWQLRGYQTDCAGGKGDPACDSCEIGPWEEERFYVVQLDEPVLSEPPHGDTLCQTAPVFKWQPLDTYGGGVIHYKFELALDPGFSTIIRATSNSYTDTSYHIFPSLPDNTYYWRVKAWNNTNKSCQHTESPTYTVTIDDAESLVYPTNPVPPDGGQFCETDGLSFNWDSMPGAVSYTIEIASSTEFLQSDIIDVANGIPSASYTSSAVFANNTTYYWRLASSDGSCTGPMSPAKEFTITEIGIPNLVAPNHEDRLCNVTNVPFSWERLEEASHYEIEISNSATFGPASQVDGSDSIIQPGGMAEPSFTSTYVYAFDHSYYWRVRAKNTSFGAQGANGGSGCYGTYSDIRTLDFGGGGYLMNWGSFGAGAEQFKSPTGVAMDGFNKVWITDRGNHRIVKTTASGLFQNYYGSYGVGEGWFSSPFGITIITDGTIRIWVTEAGNHRLQQLNSSGGYVFPLVGGIAWGVDAGEFHNPAYLDHDSAGNIYVADRLNYRVQKFSSTGSYLTVWGGYGTDPGKFQLPYGVAVNGSDEVWVSDYLGNRLAGFDSTGNPIGTIAAGFINKPKGIAFDGSGRLYALDSNDQIHVYLTDGTLVMKWGTSGEGDGQLNNAQDVFIDSGGYIYVANTGNHRIEKYCPIP